VAIDLDFKGAASSGKAANLEFGLQQTTAPEAASATIRIQLGPPTVRIRAAYNNLVSRKLEGGGHVSWQRSIWQIEAALDGWGETARNRNTAALPWQPSETGSETVVSPSSENVRSRDASCLVWQEADRIDAATTECFDPLWPAHDRLGLPWQESEHLSDRVVSPFVWLIPSPRRHSLPWQQGEPNFQHWRARFAPGIWKSERWTLPWEIGRLPRFGESPLPIDPPVEPVIPKTNPDLDFVCRANQKELAWRPRLLLNFGAGPQPGDGGFTVPILKVYFVSNSVDVVRLPGREPIPVKSLQIGIDTDSWAWGFSAGLPLAALEMIEPTSQGPVEIEIAINGVTWVMLVEGYDVRREFGQSSLGIKGRSLAAYLAEPYAPRRSFTPDAPFTARQLAEQELTRAGLVTGFNLDWRLPDWLVPAGAWSYQSLSPMGVIGRIVESVGGTVHAHPRLKTLVAKSRYPELPWNWSSVTSDLTLPIDVVKTLNLRWQEKPMFNAVYVSGERQGVTGQVVRSGTAGDVIAPMVVDGLITHADAVRERGRTILADVGKQAVVTLELPMLNSLGLLDPGLLISVGEGTPAKAWRGLVRATNITADWNQSLSVRQTIEVERHYL